MRLFPLPPSAGLQRRKGRLGLEELGVELTSGLGVMDVSIKDTETRSVTDISIPEMLRRTAGAGDADGAEG